MSIVAANVPEASSCKERKVKTRVRSFHRKHHVSKVKNQRSYGRYVRWPELARVEFYARGPQCVPVRH